MAKQNMAKTEGRGEKSVGSAESPTGNFRIIHRINGEAPNAADTGASDKVSTPQRYKKGGSVKGCSTPQPW